MPRPSNLDPAPIPAAASRAALQAGYAATSRTIAADDSAVVGGMDEEEIVVLIAAGGAPAEAGVKMLYQRLSGAMLRFYAHHGLSADDARDVLQEAMVKIVAGAAGFRARGPARAWLWQVARNCMTDHLRARQRRPEDTLDDAQWAAQGERLAAIDADAALAPAPERAAEHCVGEGLAAFAQAEPQRVAALTLYLDDLSMDEIASRLGRTPQAMRQYLYETRKKFAPYIERCRQWLQG